MWLAVLVAPSMTTLLMFGPTLLINATQFLTNATTRLVLSAVLVASYGLSYTFGIPIYLYARRRGWRTAYQYMGGAFLMGLATYPALCAVILIYAAIFAREKFWGGAYMLLDLNLVGGPIVFGLLSMPIGWAFWLMTRPDQFD
jgi:hypothetical protein